MLRRTKARGKAISHHILSMWDGIGVLPLALLSFPLFLSVDLYHVSIVLDDVINIWKLLSALIVGLLYVMKLITRSPTFAHIVPMAMIMLVLLFSTAVNSGSFEKFIIVWGGFFAVALLVETHVRERPLELLFALKIVLGLLVVLNFTTVIAAPAGLWSNSTESFWLFGHRNNFGAPIIAALVVSGAYDFLAHRRLSISTYIIAITSFVSVVQTWSASSLVAVSLAVIAVILVSLSKKGLRIFRPFVLVTLYAALDIGIVLFQVQDLISGFISQVLGRSPNLTGRVHLWDLVWGLIRESPLFGNGVQLAKNNGLTAYNDNFVHAHNGELDIVMQGGLLAFIPFVAMILFVTLAASRYYKSRAVQILFIGLIINMVRAIVGLFFSSYAVLLVFLLLNSRSISDSAIGSQPASGFKVRQSLRTLKLTAFKPSTARRDENKS